MSDGLVVVFGARSSVGRVIVPKLLAAHRSVRATARAPDSLESQAKLGAEVMFADLRDPASVMRACSGATSVIAATHAFPGRRGNDPPAVDRDGNRRLIEIARETGVGHFVFISAAGSSATHPVDFFRYKVATEELLRASGITHTILRGWLYMEFWAAMIGDAITRHGKATLFGRGENPINFVSCEDVASYAVTALDHVRLKNRTIEVGGPQNLSLREVAARCANALGRPARVRCLPTAVMRAMAAVGEVVYPPMARVFNTGLLLDTTPHSFDMTANALEFGIPMTALDDVLRKRLEASQPPIRGTPAATPSSVR